jgi:anaerobic magnesium-protoporphyrin IX monomethyl ester cyclase
LRTSLHPVVIIAFGEYDNLGAGYLLSVLKSAGIDARMIDFRYDNEEILASLERHPPLVVGFSVIYEVYIEEFAVLTKYLRNGGINCHFTAGGSFASLNPEELFRLIPEIDSIVRFEGEDTFLELVNCLRDRREWRAIRSIAYMGNGGIIKTPLRPLEKNLDRFPFPARRPLMYYSSGKRFATIVAGRGCIFDCSFCNTREFYGTPGGPLKRIRMPEMVVSEMEQLYREKGCSVFLFQDDDFPVKTAGSNNWVRAFCRELERKGLHEKILWKINCRPDEINADNFGLMKQHGLFLVFIGLEDGTDQGLTKLNKKLTTAESTRGVETLKKLDIGYDYGFMLFQPESSYTSLRENIEFLGRICSDGTAPIEVLKLMPYFNTRVEKELREQGRIKGSHGNFDYDFLMDSLNACYATVSDCFAQWLWSADGLTNISKWARNHFAVSDRFGNKDQGVALKKDEFRKTLAESNLFILDTLSNLFDVFESEGYLNGGSHTIDLIRAEAESKHKIYCQTIRECFVSDDETIC